MVTNKEMRERDARVSKQRWDTALMVAVCFVLIPWLMLAWVAGTGTTYTSSSRQGRNATEDDFYRYRKTAMATTIFVTPVAVFLFVARRRRQARNWE
jgi:Mn2+/Fe2+ NRAMP family transporter